MAKTKSSKPSKITIPAARIRNNQWLLSLGRLILVRPLPPKDVFALVRLSKQVERELQSIEATRKKLIERYGEKTEHGFTVKTEHRDQFTKDWQAVLTESIVIELERQIVLPENFESGNGQPGTTLTASDILLLEEIVIAPGDSKA